MMHIRSIVLTVLLTTAAATAAKANPCLTNADSVAWLRLKASAAYQDHDSTTMVAQGLPWARYENIQVVTDTTVCAAGIAAFNAFAGTTGTPQATTAAYILALGGTGYAFIRSGDLSQGGRRKIYVFSPTWVLKRKYMA